MLAFEVDMFQLFDVLVILWVALAAGLVIEHYVTRHMRWRRRQK